MVCSEELCGCSWCSWDSDTDSVQGQNFRKWVNVSNRFQKTRCYIMAIYILYIQWSFFKMSVVEITVDGDGITVATHSQPGNKMKWATRSPLFVGKWWVIASLFDLFVSWCHHWHRRHCFSRLWFRSLRASHVDQKIPRVSLVARHCPWLSMEFIGTPNDGTIP